MSNDACRQAIALFLPNVDLVNLTFSQQICITQYVVIGHFTVVYGSEAVGDLVLIQTFLLYYVNQVILMLTSIFQEQFP